MTKLSLKAEPTFKAKVLIPVAGDKPAEVEFTFTHRTKTELQKFVKDIDNRKVGLSDADLLLSLATGWDLSEDFSRENVELMVQMYHAAADSISKKYIHELTQTKPGQ